jgi:hypothetical protein
VFLVLFGESRMTHDFESKPPDLVAFVKRNGSPEGGFGRDHARELAEWISANYRPVWRNTRYGLELFERTRAP